MKKLGRIINTVRYMTARQWKYRIYYMVRDKLIERKVHTTDIIKKPRILPLNYVNDLCKFEAVSIAEGICRKHFNTVSDIIIKFNGQIDWDLQQENYRLVCFKLNSFKWLLDLSDAYKCNGKKKYIEKGFELIEDWYCRCTEKITGDKWNPYVIAERLFNWIGFCSAYSSLLEKDISLYASWINEQAIELRASLEYQLGANHLLSEGKALIAAGIFLRRTELKEYGKRILFTEFKEQFLEDGGHYERSISYHVESLQQYFETILILYYDDDLDTDRFIKMIKEPYKFLNGMISISGEIPLFNDSAYDYPFYNAADFLSTGEILYGSKPPNSKPGEYFARWKTLNINKQEIHWEIKELYKETGYFHHRIKSGKKEYSFYFDIADGGPDSNLGHAHADALGVLLSGEQREILVDSGVFTYKPDAERNYCRSTKAHNTVEIDGVSSAEIWSAFRIAKRGHSKILEYQLSEKESYIIASHDGYCKCLKSPVLHRREISIRNNIIQIQDYIDGKGEHKAVSRFHIGPLCSVEKIGDSECLVDREILIKCSLPLNIVECEVAGCFGKPEKTKCIEIAFFTLENNKIYTDIIFIKEEKENG